MSSLTPAYEPYTAVDPARSPPPGGAPFAAPALSAPTAPAPVRGGVRSTGWCFTINNPTLDDYQRVVALADTAKLAIVGAEHWPADCPLPADWPEAGYAVSPWEDSRFANLDTTPHLQGYLEFANGKRFQTIKQELPRAHLQARRGSCRQAWEYCEKEGRVAVQRGECPPPPAPGKRTDLERATEIVATRGISALAAEMPQQFVLHHRGFEALQARLSGIRTTAPTVTVLYGPTGTGKSHTAREMTEGKELYVWHPQQGHWFDGYEGQEAVIFEEFRGQIPFGHLLSLLDKYDCRVQRKGSTCQFSATTIIFTSPVHYSEWYESLNQNDGKMAQLERRITTTRELLVRHLPE